MSARWERLWYPPGPLSLGERLALLCLEPACAAFGAGARLRKGLYDRGLLPARRVAGLRVISVGNLTVGGSGKTPATIHLAALLRDLGRRVVVLSRGYGRRERAPLVLGAGGPAGSPPASVEGAGDEPLLIHRRCPGVPVLVGADRVALAELARRTLGAEVALLDDGLQHRRLARDLDILVVDAAVGFGNRRLLPRGPLREPLSAMERAGLIWLRTEGQGPVPPLPPDVPVVQVRHECDALLDPSGAPHPVDSLRGARVIPLAGLARPRAFVRTVEGLGAVVVERALFPDHHRFTAAELRACQATAEALGARLVTTEKDHLRLPEGFGAWVLRQQVRILAGEAPLRALLTG